MLLDNVKLDLIVCIIYIHTWTIFRVSYKMILIMIMEY